MNKGIHDPSGRKGLETNNVATAQRKPTPKPKHDAPKARPPSPNLLRVVLTSPVTLDCRNNELDIDARDDELKHGPIGRRYDHLKIR
jgi:hypothetical protein